MSSLFYLIVFFIITHIIFQSKPRRDPNHTTYLLCPFEVSFISYQTTTGPHEEMEVTATDTLKCHSIENSIYCLRIVALGHVSPSLITAFPVCAPATL